MEHPNDLPDDINDLAASVRRHHTISSVRRGHRAQPRVPISEVENEDEVVGNDWVGGVGAVGEGKGLHRQSSLPSKYNNRVHRQHGTTSGAMTPSRAAGNSLAAITAEHGIEGEDQDEELWGQIRDWKGDDLSVPPIDPAAYPQIPHEHVRSLSQSSHSSSISPMFSEDASIPPLPNNSGAGVRRHQSLTYGAHSHAAGNSGARSLMRSATTSKTGRAGGAHSRAEAASADAAYAAENQVDDVHDEGVVSPATSSTGHGSAGHGKPWGTQSSTPASSSPWGPPSQQRTTTDDLVDDVQRSLAGLEIDHSNASASGQLRNVPYQGYYSGGYGGSSSGQTLSQPPPNPNHNRKLSPPPTYPPRFRSPSPGNAGNDLSYAAAVASAALKSPSSLGGGPTPVSQITASTGRSPIHKLSLVTNLAQGQSGPSREQGPVSAAAYVPAPGAGLPLGEELGSNNNNLPSADSDITPKERVASRGPNDLQPGNSTANPLATGGLNPSGLFMDPTLFASFDPTLQQQIMQHVLMQQQSQLQQPFLGGMGASPLMQPFNANPLNLQLQMLQQQLLLQQTMYPPPPPPHGQYAQAQPHGLPITRLNTQLQNQNNPLLNGSLIGDHAGGAYGGLNVAEPAEMGGNPLASPVDVQSLIASKGYNPSNFDTKPVYARYFVIKSYTEDDVHKSLKYEIWSSTEPGNKRLDKAFKETNGRGPIYLFFSVNASGHFCGVAEMLTPVDYTRSSTVWAQDKWKGVIKVKWIFVRDVPNSALRHIRLTNTQEMKPVTNSRDTQELTAEAGHEMLRIFLSHPSRTSLLQDFAFYELQAIQRTAVGNNPLASPQPQQQQGHHTPVRQGSLPVGFAPGGSGSQQQQVPSQLGNQQQSQQQQQGVTTPPPRQGFNGAPNRT